MKDSKSHMEEVSHCSKWAPKHRCKKLQMWTWWRRKDTAFWTFLRSRRSRVARRRLKLTAESRGNGHDVDNSSPLLEKTSLKRQAERTGDTTRPDSGPSAAAPESPDGKKTAVPSEALANSRTETRINGFPHGARSDKISGKNTGTFDVSLTKVAEHIHEFLDKFLAKYGSFIPLRRQDVLEHLKKHFNTHFNGSRKCFIRDVTERQMALSQKDRLSFRVVFEKHTLTLDDFSTLDQQNWLNDQVINTYGELIMDAAQHKVHFLNTFFHRKLVAKGFDGVKRWTKQVPPNPASGPWVTRAIVLKPNVLRVLLLQCIPRRSLARRWICSPRIWCWCPSIWSFTGVWWRWICAARKSPCWIPTNWLRNKSRRSIPNRGLGRRSSAEGGHAFFCPSQNILQYLTEEAMEKRRPSFVDGWKLSLDENVPQQSTENDCGVFVLEYSRCLALAHPLRFSQRDIPEIRRRIYKELCERKLHR
ncbi:sentrin-specific protease 5-like isoform X2 [Stigmatopora argus]